MRAMHQAWMVWVVLAGALAAAACGDGGSDADTADTVQDVDTAGDTGVDTASDADTVQGDSASDADTSDVDTSGPSAPWFEHAVFYEVFVRSFQDSDGDGIGDLRGLIDRLDYLNDGVAGSGDDLEVDALWLMPIFTSPSYHGYDTTDYEAIDPDYGTMADFEALIAACEARGIKVVLDLVMNHTGRDHPWFLGARQNASDPKRGWYVWRGDDPGWKQPFGSDAVWHRWNDQYYYGIFTSGMPDLNYREPAVVTEMTRIAKGWLDRGAAGFRLDAARYLVESATGGLAEQPETHAFWKSFRAELEAHAAASSLEAPYLVGEVWTSRPAVTTYYSGGTELHQAFDFDLQNAVLQTVSKAQASWLRSELGAQKAAGAPWTFEATFLGNHDLDRASFKLSPSEIRATTFLLLTLPGTPYLYYGDELAMRSVITSGDPAKRGPMAWTATAPHGFTSGTPWLAFAPESDTRNVATALADPTSLLHLTQTLVRTRKAHPALTSGELTVLSPSDARLFAMLRKTADELLLVVVNVSNEEVPATTLDLAANLASGTGTWYISPVLGAVSPPLPIEPGQVATGAAWARHEGRIWKLQRQATPSDGGSR